MSGGGVSEQILDVGYAIAAQVFSRAEIATFKHQLSAGQSGRPAVRQRGAQVYAIRDLLRMCPKVVAASFNEMLQEILIAVIGKNCGLVRGVFFDKPPGHSWSVPWHKDLTIEIELPERVSSLYSTPRRRGDNWQCEAPAEVLEQMLTIRVHLDPATAANGALEVRPGTHRNGKLLTDNPPESVLIEAEPGDVLLLRPLLEHASRKGKDSEKSGRGVVHLEYAAQPELPDGYRWRDFSPVASLEFPS